MNYSQKLRRVAVSVFALASLSSFAASIYVSANDLHEVDGKVWGTYDGQDAYTDLQTAVNAAASGDTVWVEDGFVCDDAGGSTARSSRQVRLYIPRKMTVRTRSGAIGNAAVIRGNLTSTPPVSGVAGQGSSRNTLQGFIIENAKITGCQSGNAAEGVTLINCVVRNCVSSYNLMVNVKLDNCVVTNNAGSPTYAGIFQVGSAYNSYFEKNACGTCGILAGAGVVVSNCVFVGHTSGKPIIGGNVANPATPALVIDCVFSNNAITCIGSQYTANNLVRVERSLFTRNVGPCIAPMYGKSQGRYNNRVDIYNSVFTNNSGSTVIDSCGSLYNTLIDNNGAGVKVNNPDVDTELGIFNSTIYGGVKGNTFAINSIIKDDPDTTASTVSLVAATNCCLKPGATVGSGENNITDDELLVNQAAGIYIPTETSPCLKGGSVTAYELTEKDLAGASRQHFPGFVAIGAYEYSATAMMLTQTGITATEYMVAPAEVKLTANAVGFGFEPKFYWDVNGDGLSEVETDIPVLTYDFPAGTWAVGLCASNIAEGVGASMVFDQFSVRERGVHYVREGNWDNAVAPYSTIETAAARIQDAVDVAAELGEVVILPGIYTNAAEVAVTKPITVRGSTGNPEDVVVRHVGSTGGRCLRVNHPLALVHSLTCERGASSETFYYGGGVMIGEMSGNNSVAGNGTVSNLIVRSCSVSGKFAVGSGIYAKGEGAFVTHCVVSNCTGTSAYIDGGYTTGLGLHLTSGAKAENCLVAGNWSGYPYNGQESNVALTNGYHNSNFHCAVFVGPNSLLSFSTVVGNKASYCGGVNVAGSGRFENCVIAGNKALCKFLTSQYGEDAARLNVWSAFPEIPSYCFFRGFAASEENKALCWTSFTNIVAQESARAANPLYYLLQTTNAVDVGVLLGEGTMVSSADMLFRNFAKGDYSLRSGSPARDAVPRRYVTDMPETDLSGKPRLVNMAYDLGCFECQAPASLRFILR